MQPNYSGTCNTAKSYTKYSRYIYSAIILIFFKVLSVLKLNDMMRTWMIVCSSKMFFSDVCFNSSDAFDGSNLAARISALIDHFLKREKKQD